MDNILISKPHEELETQKNLNLQVWRIGESFRQVLITLGQEDIIAAILAKAFNEDEFIRLEEGAEEEEDPSETPCSCECNDDLYLSIEELYKDNTALSDEIDTLKQGLQNADIGNEILANRVEELESHLKAIHKIVWQARNSHGHSAL